jgi:hypothetical protein
MGDFLSNLVAKSLNRTEGVQPRTRSLFEPLPGTRGRAPGFVPGLEQDGEQARAEVETGSVRQGERAPRRAGPTSPATSVSLRSGSWQAAQQDSSERMQEPRVQAPAFAPPATVVQPTGNPRGEPGLGATRGMPSSWRPGASLEFAGAVSRREGLEVEGHPAFEPLVRERVIERIVAPESRGTPSGGELHAERAEADGSLRLHSDRRQPEALVDHRPLLAAERVVVQPQVKLVPRSEPEIPASVPSTAEVEPAPTIHVSIGRIEVRATPPATAARKPRSAPPVMSLDEYLKRHTRGGGE